MKRRHKVLIGVAICVLILGLCANVFVPRPAEDCTDCKVVYEDVVAVHTATANATKNKTQPIPIYKVVWFWEPDCPACEQMKPTVVSLSNTVSVKTVNIFDVPSAIKNYSLNMTPTTIVYKDGKQIARFEDVVSLQTIKASMK